MRTLLVGGCALQLLVQQGGGLQIFKAWLEREHPGYGSDEGPARFRNAIVEVAYPERRFYYVLTYPRGIGIARNALTLVAQISDRGTVLPLVLTSPATYRPGLKRVVTERDARRAAAAVLILALGDPLQRRWRFEENRVTVERNKNGWVCTYSYGVNYVSRVTFDNHGTLTEIDPRLPPVA